MRRYLILLLILIYMPAAFATDAANIKIKIKGRINDNSYFLCLPNVGCLSILAAKKGKVYPLLREFKVNSLYVTNVRNFKVYSEGQPPSCNVTVKPSQTISIYGNLVVDARNQVRVNQLRCSVS